MRYLTLAKMLGMGALIALALTALPAVAAATPAVLCEENLAECTAESTYPPGSSVEATLKSGTTLTVKNNALFSTAETCTSSTLKGETLEQGRVHVSSLTVTGCKGMCSTVGANNLPYTAGVEGDGSGNGTLEFKNGGKGEPGFQFSGCSFGVTCTFGLSGPSFPLQGGNPAELGGHVELPYQGGSGTFVCGTATQLYGEYKVVTPAPLYVSETSPNSESVLCEGNAWPSCYSEETYPAETELSGESSEVRFEFNGLFSPKLAACHSAIGISTGAESGEPLPASLESLSFSSCSGPCSSVSAKSLPASMSIEASGGGNGEVETQIALKFSGCQFGAVCEFATPTGGATTHLELAGGSSPKVKFEKAKLEYKGGSGSSLCGSELGVTGEYELLSPGPIWVKTSV